ncbi:hypothetical protein CLOSTMETH_03057 [[Clostridium] methylpentosum DSM 5476]|uniref:Uncharacterized protein n=1 Tax=[Clostridium] methylpentosum DSM 5476 TaxID=537013 RepID=C0EGR4_9FIRM|nr:hypothetical protein CLOSTMETH_03057 [[Clostridium] methylpentosum DSM 5476]
MCARFQKNAPAKPEAFSLFLPPLVLSSKDPYRPEKNTNF